MTYVICDAIWAWETWAYLHDPVGLVKLGAVHEHYCAYYPRKVPRCPACAAGLPVRKVSAGTSVSRDLMDAVLNEMLEVEIEK